MKMDQIRRLTMAAAAALALGSVSPAAPAGDLDPPMPALSTVSDKNEIASIDLPAGSSPRSDWAADEPDALGAWDLELDASSPGPEGTVYLKMRTGSGSAVLAGSMGRANQWGTLEEDSVVAERGEWRDRRVDPSHGELFCQRVVAAKGQVYFAVVQMKTTAYDPWKAHVDAILDTLKPLGTPKGLELPATYKLIATKPGDVWSDGKKGDTDRIIREWGNALAMWQKVLPGTPVFTNAPRLVLCTDDADYSALWGNPKSGAAPPTAFYAGSMRAVVVRLSKRKEDSFVHDVQRTCGSQMSEYFFGGRPPLWIGEGLRMYLLEGVVCNGHFDQPRADMIDKARTSANERGVSFADIMDMTEMPRGSRNGIDRELFAWHFFFCNGGGVKTYGDRYKKCLDVLRSSGDAREARKAWDGTDHEALKREYTAWIQTWREGKAK